MICTRIIVVVNNLFVLFIAQKLRWEAGSPVSFEQGTPGPRHPIILLDT